MITEQRTRSILPLALFMGCEVEERHLEMAKPTKKKKNQLPTPFVWWNKSHWTNRNTALSDLCQNKVSSADCNTCTVLYSSTMLSKLCLCYFDVMFISMLSDLLILLFEITIFNDIFLRLKICLKVVFISRTNMATLKVWILSYGGL